MPSTAPALPPLPRTAAAFNQSSTGMLPGHLGIRITHVEPGVARAELPLRPELMAPNGFLHAASLVALADTAAGCGCMASLTANAIGFTTLELKSNHLATAQAGTLDCEARAAHLGKTTQVWDATVTHRESGRTLMLFRCTQMVLHARAAG